MMGDMSSDLTSVLVVEVAQRRVAFLAAAVDEVLPAALPVPLPGAPDVVDGLLDVRGDTVPVVDVRRRFGLARGRSSSPTASSCCGPPAAGWPCASTRP
jgi:chemotaxis signal transduction protein